MTLKGHTKIELTDVNTGKVDTYEDDNMVTNAVTKLLTDYGTGIVSSMTNINGNFFPDYLGGMLLFKNALVEDANAYFPSGDNEVVGNAAYNSSSSPTDNPYMGTYNATESHVDDRNKTVTFVYDFTTSQANGSISAISLTSLRAGKCMPFGIKDGGESSFADRVGVQWEFVRKVDSKKRYTALTSSVNKPFLVSFTNDCVYTWRLDDANTLVIGKSRLYLSSIGIFDTQYNSNVEDFVTISLDGLSNTNTYGYNYDRHTDKLYIMCTNNVAHGSLVKFIEYDVTHQTGVVKAGANQLNNSLDMNNMYVNKGKLYVHIGSGKWGTISLSNPTDVRVLNGAMRNEISSRHKQPFAIGDYVYCDWGNDTDTGNVRHLRKYVMDDTHVSQAAGLADEYYDRASNHIPCAESDLLFAERYGEDQYSHYNQYGAICMYLATINNLETPVVKTSDKTMKITYTLTETE
jgi:hypothetical protein